MFDQDENLRNAILKQKARLADIELRLNRASVRHVRLGMESKVSPNGGQRMQEERIHLQERIAELEAELLLRQYHRSRNDPFALAAIEQKLSEYGTPVRRPEGYATFIETPSSPVKDSSHDKRKQKKRESIREKILSDPQGKIRYDEAATFYGVSRRTIARRVEGRILGSPSRSFVSNASVIAYDRKHHLKQL